MSDLITLGAAARALGVSASTLKRWCNAGKLPLALTAGKHRRLSKAAVVCFARAQGLTLRAPELLGLKLGAPGSAAALGDGARLLHAALRAGDQDEACGLALGLHLRRCSIAELGDQVLAPAFRMIGEDWHNGVLDVYQERRACGIAKRLLHELRKALPEPPADAPRALGGALAGDEYQLPGSLVELTLHEQGWRAEFLGRNLPAESFARAVTRERPRLAWVCVAHVEDETAFLEGFARLAELAHRQGTALVAGGRALTPELRQRMACAACCDNLAQLVVFAATQRDRAAPA